VCVDGQFARCLALNETLAIKQLVDLNYMSQHVIIWSAAYLPVDEDNRQADLVKQCHLRNVNSCLVFT